MPTTGVINSTLLKVYVGGTAVTLATDASISITHSPRDITNKDSAGWTELLEGLRGATISTGAMMAYDSAFAVDDLYAMVSGRTTAVVMFSTEVTGDTFYSGNAYITSLEQNSPGAEDNATYSASFQLTGAITEGTVA